MKNRFDTLRVVIISISLICSACARHVTITVTNATQEPIRDIQLLYTGGSSNIQQLLPAMSRTLAIRPSGESGLTIRYRDGSGIERSKDADVYLERGYSGTIAITMRPNAEVMVSSNVRP